MSQDASRSQTLHSPTKTSSSSPSWEGSFGSEVTTESGGFSAESYADRLMDELFGEIEQSLEMRTRLPDTPLEPEPPAKKQPSVSSDPGSTSNQFALPLAVSPRQELVLDGEEAIAPAEPTKLATPVKKVRSSGRSYDRLLIGIGCVSVAATIAIWFISQEAKQPPAANSAGSTQVAANAKAASNSQFSNYVNQALQAIEQKAQPPGSGSTVKPGASTSTLPTVTLPATQTPARPPARPSTGLGRLLAPVTPLPAVVLPNQTASAPLPNIAAANRPTSSAVQPDPTQRKIVGLMERTDRFPAVALIEINGVVQRFQVGESVGSSGWNLVEVSKNQAIVRRNGEVRSVFIGQTF